MKRWRGMIFLLLLAGQGWAAGPIAPGETVDLDRCLAIARQRHPAILAATASLKASDSKVGQARAGYYPQLNASTGYSRSDPVSSFRGGATDNYSATLSLNQNLYDFGKTSLQVAIQELGRDSSRLAVENVIAQVLFGVKQAYFGLLQADRNRQASRETVRQFEQHLERAKAFFAVGTKPKFDVTKAEVDLSAARLNLLKAENAYRLAAVALNNAMGLPEAAEYRIAEEPPPPPLADLSLEEAIRRAYERRPDLRSLGLRRKALSEAIELARLGYYPLLSGSAGYGWGGDGFPLDRGWSVGAQLSIPIFSGYLTRYQVEEARANLEALLADEANLRQTIHQEVKQAWLVMEEAGQRIEAARLAVRQAEENLELAEGRYNAGVGSPIEVTDALAALSSAKTSLSAALYDHRVARASLEKAMGEQ